MLIIFRFCIIVSVKQLLHDTTGCQTGCQTDKRLYRVNGALNITRRYAYALQQLSS